MDGNRILKNILAAIGLFIMGVYMAELKHDYQEHKLKELFTNLNSKTKSKVI